MPKISKYAPDWYRRLMDECPPRNHTVPDWRCPRTLYQYQRYMVIADWIGFTPMPWQRLVLAILSMPRCYELVLVVGRQQGKTTVLIIPCIDEMLKKPWHTVIYSAQKGLDANNKIKKEFVPAYEGAGLDDTTGFIFNKGTHDFGIHAMNGTQLRTISSDKESARGETRVALGIIDEARADRDHNRAVIITPMMNVVPDAHLINASTAGHAGSIYLENRLEDARAKFKNKESVICLAEWGIDTEKPYEASDRKLWQATLPGLNYICTEETINRAYETLLPHDFAMEYLGRWLDSDIEVAIPDDEWAAICSKKTALEGSMVLALDAPPEQDRTAAVVCDEYGQVELVGVRQGSDTAHQWATRILEKNSEIDKVVMADNNTLRPTGERLRRDGYEVKWYNTRMMHTAASRFWEAVHSEPRQVAIRTDAVMNQANKGAFRWQLGGGAWVFMRQTPEEFCSPLIAATMAYDSAVVPGEEPGGSDDLDDWWEDAEKNTEDIWDL